MNVCVCEREREREREREKGMKWGVSTPSLQQDNSVQISWKDLHHQNHRTCQERGEKKLHDDEETHFPESHNNRRTIYGKEAGAGLLKLRYRLIQKQA